MQPGRLAYILADLQTHQQTCIHCKDDVEPKTEVDKVNGCNVQARFVLQPDKAVQSSHQNSPSSDVPLLKMI